MMTAFMADHPFETMELCVLADNIGAIRLYKDMGFRIVKQMLGFSISGPKPKCLEMIKES